MKKVIFDYDKSDEVYFEHVISEDIIVLYYESTVYILEENMNDDKYIWNSIFSGYNNDKFDDEEFISIKEALDYAGDYKIYTFNNQIEFLEWCIKVQKNE